MIIPDGPMAKPLDVSAEQILTFLTERQHLGPHTPIHAVIHQTTQKFGCCPQAIERGMEWLAIDPMTAIGRLRRSELVQLARAVHRFWSQAIASNAR